MRLQVFIALCLVWSTQARLVSCNPGPERPIVSLNASLAISETATNETLENFTNCSIHGNDSSDFNQSRQENGITRTRILAKHGGKVCKHGGKVCEPSSHIQFILPGFVFLSEHVERYVLLCGVLPILIAVLALQCVECCEGRKAYPNYRSEAGSPEPHKSCVAADLQRTRTFWTSRRKESSLQGILKATLQFLEIMNCAPEIVPTTGPGAIACALAEPITSMNRSDTVPPDGDATISLYENTSHSSMDTSNNLEHTSMESEAVRQKRSVQESRAQRTSAQESPAWENPAQRSPTNSCLKPYSSIEMIAIATAESVLRFHEHLKKVPADAGKLSNQVAYLDKTILSVEAHRKKVIDERKQVEKELMCLRRVAEDLIEKQAIFSTNCRLILQGLGEEKPEKRNKLLLAERKAVKQRRELVEGLKGMNELLQELADNDEIEGKLSSASETSELLGDNGLTEGEITRGLETILARVKQSYSYHCRELNTVIRAKEWMETRVRWLSELVFSMPRE